MWISDTFYYQVTAVKMPFSKLCEILSEQDWEKVV